MILQNLPSADDLKIRWTRIQKLMKEQEGDACLISSFVNIYYLTGKMFDGYIYIPQTGEPVYFVKKPVDFEDERAVFIRKPEDIPEILKNKNISFPKSIGLEADQLTYNEYIRLQKIFDVETYFNASTTFRKSRMLKTPWEIDQFRYAAKLHKNSYKRIPSFFRPGMTDLEFQYDLEKNMRQHGSIGIFRTFGSNMDIFMGSILAGNNAQKPSPFDFALGGAGTDALPLGANGSIIEKGQSVMVDLAGNFTAYMTDMSRTYSYGKLPELAYKAHQVSIDLHNWLRENGKPGLACSEIYDYSLEAVKSAGLSDYFMGTIQQAKFVGHGVGIEINELPVLMSRSKDKLHPGMIFAYEPKFVIPEVGAVGIENTYLVLENGLENLTDFEENIIALEWI